MFNRPGEKRTAEHVSIVFSQITEGSTYSHLFKDNEVTQPFVYENDKL